MTCAHNHQRGRLVVVVCWCGEPRGRGLVVVGCRGGRCVGGGKPRKSRAPGPNRANPGPNRANPARIKKQIGANSRREIEQIKANRARIGIGAIRSDYLRDLRARFIRFARFVRSTASLRFCLLFCFFAKQAKTRGKLLRKAALLSSFCGFVRVPPDRGLSARQKLL